jgi:hypothetical protein
METLSSTAECCRRRQSDNDVAVCLNISKQTTSPSTPPCLLAPPSQPPIMSHTSVASKRLFQEYKALLSAPPDGITAGPVNEDDLFVWEALIQGPEGTPFEGGIFPAELKFPKDYPLNPPKMKFLGEIWYASPATSFPRYSNPHYLGTRTCTPMAKSVYRYYIPQEMIQITTSKRASGGVPYKVWRRS